MFLLYNLANFFICTMYSIDLTILRLIDILHSIISEITSDVEPDPDSLRSVDPDSDFFFFSQEIIFFKSEPKKVANL